LKVAEVKPRGIAPDVVAWQRLHGRHDLPWQGSGDPYRIWLSEVMLQQTQVATVMPYFNAFIAAFPTVAELAAAQPDEVMSLWSGLGYYSRARNLHAAARLVVERHGGRFPGSAAALADLPGVGQSTAAAIAVFAFGERAAILDGNVKRVFCRVFAVAGHPGEAAVMRRLWLHAQAELPVAVGETASAAVSDIQSYTQGLMDLGATLCTRSNPACGRCPLREKCQARLADAVDRFPSARPPRTVPVREVEMLLLFNGASVLLEQRPPTGIWGGLWSLPELVLADGAAPIAAAGLALAPSRLGDFMRFEHLFTHFRMKARVWRAELDEVEAVTALRQTPPTRWLALADAAGAPLPSPIKSLLLSRSAQAPTGSSLFPGTA
jgi:A/G-specific adenine glycosylase